MRRERRGYEQYIGTEIQERGPRRARGGDVYKRQPVHSIVECYVGGTAFAWYGMNEYPRLKRIILRLSLIHI